jgi:hypothetical protein
MKLFSTIITSVFAFVSYAQITYVDWFDAVYPLTSGSTTFNLDLNNDSENDIKLYLNHNATSSINCGSTTGTGWHLTSFIGLTNTFGQNKVNGPSSLTPIGIDCTNDTLNVLDLWNNQSNLYKGWYASSNLCFNLGTGSHKQGFRLILTNPANGALGYKYGYIDYTISSNGDVIVHGWYYENTFNVPIVANSQLDYPYDGNCIHYDSVTVYDTITTTIYDTITTNIFDTVLVSVTDTLFIETTLGTNPLSQNTISVFPNPTNDHITIHTGNYALMSNYSIKIENSLGQVVFTNPLNQQTFYVDLNGWSGNGVYYLKLLDSQSNEVTVRKIVLQ